MAYEDIVTAPWIQHRIQQGLGLKGNTASPSVSPEVTPVVIVADLRQDCAIESSTVRRCIGGGEVTAAVNRPTVYLFNPANSQSVFLLESFLVRGSAVGAVYGWIMSTPIGAGTSSGKALRATGMQGDPAGLVEAFDVALPAVTSRVFFGGTGNGTGCMSQAGMDLLIAPGTGFSVGLDVAAASLLATFWWREMPATL